MVMARTEGDTLAFLKSRGPDESATIPQRFGQMTNLDISMQREIGDRSGDLDDPVIGASGERKGLRGRAEQLFRIRGERCHEHPPARLGVARHPIVGCIPLPLPPTCGLDAMPYCHG